LETYSDILCFNVCFRLDYHCYNNYIDTKTNGQKLAFKRTSAKLIIYVLFGISAGLGLYLAYLTDIVVLLLGMLCFLCGVFYTYGPVPISRQPLGEILSGVFYGLLLPFILLYINLPDGTFILLNLSWSAIDLSVKVVPMITVLLLSIVPMCATANIMLANNTCDVEKDIAVKRYTLPYYLGKKALYLFAGLYYIAYLDIVLMVIFKILPPVCLIALLTLFITQKNISIFLKEQNKATTFICSIKNYITIMGGITLAIFISGLIY
jgi:1,4-dihydroxy-2-naphthoate octaprenyltransferase